MMMEWIDGRYRVVRTLGHGGRGEVRLVTDTTTGAPCALKWLREPAVSGAVRGPDLESFQQEFRVLQQLQHPHIARIADFGHDAASGRSYFTQAFIDGTPLVDALAAATPAQIEAAIVQVLRALEFLHARRIYHFDIKSANLLVERGTGLVRVIDFGLANLPGHVVAGSPATMAPEVWRGEPRDGRTDLYALGVVWYECLAGANPFVAAGRDATRDRHLRHEAARISAQRPDVPTYLDAILARLLAKQASARFATAADVIRALNQAGGHQYAIETAASSAAYLPDAGPLIGRDALWAALQRLVATVGAGSAPGVPIALLVGARGSGKTRVARELVALAQVQGIRVACEDADAPRTPPEVGRVRACALHPPPDVQLLIITAMPDEAAALRAWLPAARVHPVTLMPFARADIAAYARRVTGMDAIPAAFLDAVLARTEGNPAWVRELFAGCLAQQHFVDAHGRWSEANFADLRVELNRLPVTAGMEGYFDVRLAELPPAARAAVEVLSVAQHPLPQDVLSTLINSRGDWTSVLTALAWLRWEDGAVSLANPGLREFVRRGLAPADRMLWHDRLAALSMRLPHESLDYHRAFGSDAALAAPALRCTIAQCAREEAWATIVEAVAWAWHARPADPARIEWGIAWVNAVVESDAEAIDAIANEVEAAIVQLPAIERLRWHVALAGERIERRLRRREFAEARAAITTLLHDAAQLPRAEVLRLQNYLGRLHLEAGELAAAEAILTATWAEAAALSNSEWLRTANNDLALLYLQRQEYAAARTQCEREWARLQGMADQGLEARCRYNWGEACRGLGELDAATEQLRAAYACASAVGHHALTLRSLNALGNLYHQRGESAMAIDAYERGLRVAARLGCRESSAALATNLSILLRANGRTHDAETQLLQVDHWLRDAERSAAETHVFARALLERARLAQAQQDPVAARALLAEAAALAQSGPAAALLPFITETKQEVTMPVAPTHPPALQQPQAAHVTDPTLPWQRVLEINQQLARITDQASLLTLILGHAVALARAELGLVLLLDATNTLRIEARYNVEPDAAMAQVSATIARRAMESGRALLTDDAMQEADWNAAESVVLGQLRAVLCLPIHAAGRVIGVLYLSHRFQSGVFHDLDTTLCAAFADQAGLAIERAQLLAAAAARTEQLAATVVARETELARLEATPAAGEGIVFRLKDLHSHAPRMGKLFQLIQKILPTDISVCLHGETGTGKEVIARLLHTQHPERGTGPFIPICCGAIPKEIMESELFGYRAGAFTGATRDKPGLFEAAHGGTLFLDEVAELPLELQSKLLRVLQEREVRRLGETTARAIDCRIIAASHRALADAIRVGTFREDLYYRLCQLQLDLPPLRERREDLPMLVEQFVARAMRGKKIPHVARDVWRRFMAYDWPGNVRELEHLVTAMCALCDGKVLRVADLPPHHPLADGAMPTEAVTPARVVSARGDKPQDIRPPLRDLGVAAIPIDPENMYDPTKSWRDYESLIVAKALAHYHYDARRTASALGLSPAKLYKLVQVLGLRDPAHPLYADPFRYRDGERLGTYLAKIFAAALRAHAGRPYPTIHALQVSPGYFYKVIPTAARAQLMHPTPERAPA